jgi:hypothetical protein
MGVDSYRALEFQVFVLRFQREATSGAWRGQIVHLPDQQSAAFANWNQAQAFVARFVMNLGQSGDGDQSTSPP